VAMEGRKESGPTGSANTHRLQFAIDAGPTSATTVSDNPSASTPGNRTCHKGANYGYFAREGTETRKTDNRS